MTPHLRFAVVAFGLLTGLLMARQADAQAIRPSDATPSTLRPVSPEPEQQFSLPAAAPASVPPEAGKLFVRIGKVKVEGAFPEFAKETAAIAGTLEGHRISVAQVYAEANRIEQIYARHGYVLVRVTVPPQQLANGGTLKLLVIDGYIERVETKGVPERLRQIVADRTEALVGQRHLKIGELERRVLLAGDVSGLSLKSTLARGSKIGGTRLVLEGSYKPFSFSAGGDSRLPTSLGSSETRLSASYNNPFGFGGQVYVSGGSSIDAGQAFDSRDPLRFVGFGAVIPVGLDGLIFNPEYTYSSTHPVTVAGAPRVSGLFDRVALRGSYPAIRSHDHTFSLTGEIDFIRQRQRATDFAVDLDHDSYASANIGFQDTLVFGHGTVVSSGLTLTHGLGGRGQPEVFYSQVPLSRQGAGSIFSKLTGTVHLSQPLPAGLMFDLNALGQSSFGKPLLSPEQFALDGGDAVSAFPAGSFSVDQGATLRAELRRPFALSRFVIAPYVFAAAGRGEICEPTIVEQKIVAAQALGLGVRTNASASLSTLMSPAWAAEFQPGLSVGLEAARQFSNVAGFRHGWRVSADAALQF